MRDGVHLAADIYLPEGPPRGTILMRSPYGRGLPYVLPTAHQFAARGYVTLLVSSRGTSGSEGVFAPMSTEAGDGQDVVEWMRSQPWYTGRFATTGMSYLGFTQWALLADPPKDQVAAVVMCAPHDFYKHAWGTGAFQLDFLGWSKSVARQMRGNRDNVLSHLRMRGDLSASLNRLPLTVAGRDFLGTDAPWWEDWVTRPDENDDLWDSMRHGSALDRASIPILLIGGWRDLFLEQTLEQYERLRDRGQEVALTIGDWNHLQVSFGKESNSQALDWLDTHLGQLATPGRQAQVLIECTSSERKNAEAWRALSRWPPITTEKVLHAGPGGVLADDASDCADVVSFVFDPRNPTPTVGGLLLLGGGRVKEKRLVQRSDVITFDSQPLAEPLEVAGLPEVRITHRRDNLNADLMVRLSELTPNGISRNLTQAYRRLDGTSCLESVVVKMHGLHHRFAKGSRIRLVIAGGSLPHYARNLGTGDNPGTGTRTSTCTHTVAISGTTLTLQVVVS